MKSVSIGLAALFLVLAGSAGASVPDKISFQGYVTDLSQTPISGEHVMGFKIYDTQNGGNLLWSDTDTLQLTNGQFHAYLGDNTPLPAGIFSGSVLWLETVIDGSALPIRQPLVSVAYSFRAEKADTASVALYAQAGGDACLWKADGADVWRANGNVGIGVSSPAEKLDLDGNLKLGVGSGVKFEAGDFDPYLKDDWGVRYHGDLSHPMQIDSSSFLVGYTASGNTYPAGNLIVSGNVGVGTVNPGYKLDVVGGFHADWVGCGSDFVGGPSGEEWIIHTRAQTGGDFLQITDRDNGGDWKWGQGIILRKSGNVGIATTEPAYKLDVAGSTRIQGDLCVTGAKNAIVSTSQGMTKVYSEESAEVWFSDYGEGKLNNGRIAVELDPLFLQTVTIDENNPMKVFVTLNSDCNGVYVKRGGTGFEVIELNGGTSNAPFSYRVVAKRNGMERLRLEATK